MRSMWNYDEYEHNICADCGECCDEEDYTDEDEICKRGQEISLEPYKQMYAMQANQRLFHYMVTISGAEAETVKVQIFRNKKHCDICNSGATSYRHHHMKTKKHAE
jgi:hypothetical protein